jgi:RsiW-degrading membrane proteinase PrsW (M82 family)
MAGQIDGITAADVPRSAPTPPTRERVVQLPARLWRILLVAGLAVWLFSAAITEITNDDILVPTVIVVGSFLVPATMVSFALSRRRAPNLTVEEVVLGFLAAGTLGVVATALLETYLLPAAAGTFIGVGLIEETAKGLVLVAVAHRIHERDGRDGMVLGAIVGAGFAAFESAGYALKTMLDHIHEHPVIDILETEATRALLAPFGHITWTALLGGALFAASRGGRFRITWGLVATWVGVVTLHALWDETYGWAIMFAKGATGAGWGLEWPNAQAWAEVPSNSATFWFNVFYDVLLGLNAIVGTLWIVRSWRRYGRRAAV